MQIYHIFLNRSGGSYYFQQGNVRLLFITFHRKGWLLFEGGFLSRKYSSYKVVTTQTSSRPNYRINELSFFDFQIFSNPSFLSIFCLNFGIFECFFDFLIIHLVSWFETDCIVLLCINADLKCIVCMKLTYLIRFFLCLLTYSIAVRFLLFTFLLI